MDINIAFTNVIYKSAVTPGCCFVKAKNAGDAIKISNKVAKHPLWRLFSESKSSSTTENSNKTCPKLASTILHRFKIV